MSNACLLLCWTNPNFNELDWGPLYFECDFGFERSKATIEPNDPRNSPNYTNSGLLAGQPSSVHIEFFYAYRDLKRPQQSQIFATDIVIPDPNSL